MFLMSKSLQTLFRLPVIVATITFSGFAIAQESAVPADVKLVQLARDHFKGLGDISQSEEKLLNRIALGESTKFLPTEVIRADRVTWLCQDSKASQLITRSGIQIEGAQIHGELKLPYLILLFPIIALHCSFEDPINMDQAHLLALKLDGSTISRLSADEITVDHDVTLANGFKSSSIVTLRGSAIGGDVVCDGGSFAFLNISSAKIGGSVHLGMGFHAKGTVYLDLTTIGQKLDCDSGLFDSSDSEDAILARGIQVKAVYLAGLQANGSVDVSQSTIGGNLICNGAAFQGKHGIALRAEYLKVDGSVSLNDVLLGGKLVLSQASIAQTLSIEHVNHPDQMIIDLRFAKAGTFRHDRVSWPLRNNLALNGFVFDLIGNPDVGGGVYDRARSEIQWIRLQSSEGFDPQPYEQTAKALRRMGLPEDAIEVLIAKNLDQGRHSRDLTSLIYYRFIGPLIGFGYRASNVMMIGMIFVTIGALVFYAGHRRSLFRSIEGNDKSTQKFNAWIYSIQTFVPIIQFRMSDYWEPDTSRGRYLLMRVKEGELLRFYFWIHITAGWVLATLFTYALTLSQAQSA
jgi:hypothetical protein